MNVHDHIDEIAPEFAAGRLDAETARAVELHLAACAECAAFAVTLSDLSLGFRTGGRGLLTPHPEPLRLADFADGRERDETVAGHLASCATCRLEVEAHRAAAPTAKVLPFVPRAHAAPVARRRFTVPASLAAGMIVGVGLMLLYRPLPEAEPVAGSPGWSGPVELALLESPLRGDGAVAHFAVAPGQPYVPLALPITLPEATTDADRFRVEVQAASSPSAGWSIDLDAGTLRAQISRTGVATFLIPSRALEPGRHDVRVVPVGGGDPLLEIPFDVLGH